MAERKENNDNYPSRANDGDNDTDEIEYPPNVVRLDPDIGLGNRTQQRKRRSSGSNLRREEGNISFRHFLQNGSGGHSSTTSYPDLYNCSRQERPLIDGSVVDPESPDLPDFVQDHIAVEHMYFNDGNSQSTVNVQNLPDFASCVPHHENNEMRMRRRSGDYMPNHENRRLSRPRVPLDLPVPNFDVDEPPINANASLPFDLTTQAGAVPSTCDVRSPSEIEVVGSGGRLPDFLSDGHILGTSNPRHRDGRIAASENGAGLEAHAERHNLISTLRQENNRLLEELAILQSVLMKKDDRIKELEDLVVALEISKLQISADANTQTTSKSMGEDESRHSKREIQLSKSEKCELQNENALKLVETCSNYLPSRVTKPETNVNFTEKVREMTSTSERLVRELLKIIVEMQADVCLNDTPSSSKHKSDNDPDDSASGSPTVN